MIITRYLKTLWLVYNNHRFIIFIAFWIFSYGKIHASAGNDTIVISFAPSNCKNCIIDMPFIDSILKSNNYQIQYYLYGLRKNEINYYLQNEINFIRRSQIIERNSFFDSLYSINHNNLFIKRNNKIIACEDFILYYAAFSKVIFDESNFPLNTNGRFKTYNDKLIYFDGAVFNKLALFGYDGKLIKEINYTPDSLIYCCYKQVYKNNYKYTHDIRTELSKSGAFSVNKEITIRNVEVYKNNIYVFCSVRIFQLVENRFRTHDLIIKLNNRFDIIDYYVSEERKYKDDLCSSIFTFENYSMQSEGTVIRPIYYINPTEQNKFNVLGLFELKDHKIYLDSIIRINSTFLNKNSSNSFYMLIFSNTFYFNSKLYFNCEAFPYIYEYTTGKEIKLFSKTDLDEIDNYDEATPRWPFYVLKLEAVGSYLYEYSREENKIQLTIFDSNFVAIKKVNLDLIGQDLKKKDIIKIIHTDNDKIQFFVFTEDESYYKEYIF